MAIPLSPRLITLGRYLAGEFDNQLQALAEPTWYVHLRVWQRPIKLFSDDSLTFFIEQVSVVTNQPPYRQRILRLQDEGSTLLGQYYGLKEPLKFRGGGIAPDLLSPLTEADLVSLPTCRVAIEVQGELDDYRFKAAMAPDTLCSFEYEGSSRYVRLGFEIGPPGSTADSPLELRIYDQGVDPNTGTVLWGALMGPFCLHKKVDFNQEL